MISVIVCGSTGRMGQSILKLLQEEPDLKLGFACHRSAPLEEGIGQGDVIIEFTLPAPCLLHTLLAKQHKKPIVIGTTGFTEEQKEQIVNISKTIPVILSSNMSVGVNVLWHLIRETSGLLGKDFKATIEETHHIHKKDKPSGTAKTMAEIVENLRNVRPAVESIRTGEVIGDHSITFASDREELTIAHHAKTRDIFAEGSIRAARWIVGKKPGLYSMAHVLGLSS